MNTLNRKRVLAFDLHPLCFGFVVTEGPDELIDWGVRSFRGGANAVKTPMSKRLASLIDEYRPNALLVRTPRAGISRRANLIAKLAAARHLPVRTLSLDAIREAFPHTNRNKHEIAKAVAEREPIYGIAAHTAFLKSAVAALQPEDLEILRDARRKSLYNVSDESLDEYLAFTQVMIGLINRLDLYKEFRAH